MHLSCLDVRIHMHPLFDICHALHGPNRAGPTCPSLRLNRVDCLGVYAYAELERIRRECSAALASWLTVTSRT
jgi:hypothetical protein